MPTLTKSVPKYRRHKRSGQAVVTLNGVDHYLGPYGTVTSKTAYDARIAEWLANGRRTVERCTAPLNTTQLCVAYLKYAQGYYQKDGRCTGVVPGIKMALKILRTWYGNDPAADFGPLRLKALRQKMIEDGLSRRYINDQVDRLRRMFKWAAGEQMIGEEVYRALTLVEGLRRGRSGARETSRVTCISDNTVTGRRNEPPIDLVTSGPEAPGIANRDTAVVVRELFAHANKSVLVVGYTVYQGANVFEALAERMQEKPNLDVKLFLNIARPDRDTTKAEIIVSRFAKRFRDSQWPRDYPLPEVYYDPRSVDEDKRSSLHAKCVVVDLEQVFVSSANFTKAGQERNIEVGLRIESPWLAGRLTRHFQLLHEHGLAVRAF